ncbi:unnamed protein product [Porites evermanni]|uniref:receptor protein-tyrosine kinase n=1 Tax=Porites evermanni TaxID=104178 RepID=A0ABN8LR40_9CNID|nr:unnamed protein product [Porites evermanni]
MQNCVEHFDVYTYQATKYSNKSDFDPGNGKYDKLSTVKLPSNLSSVSVIPWSTVQLSLFIKEGTSEVFLAIHDQGACLKINSVLVTYSVCPKRTLPDSLVVLPETMAPTNESETVKVVGECTDHSESTSLELEAICRSNGDWLRAENGTGVCLCKLGWEKVAAQCQECKVGYFKDKLGNTQCTECPLNSVTETVDRKYCKCKRGFFRAAWEKITDNCTAVPSKPRHLRSLAGNQTTVSLSWSHPHHSGGRRDVYYELECKIVCQKEQTSCSQDCGSQVVFLPRQRNLSHTKATVTKLFSATAYRLRIYAKNGVSAVAEKEGVPSEYAELEITTLESAPEQPIVTVKRLDSTSIRVSWKLKNGNKGIKYFLVMYHPAGRESEKITKNTTKMELTVNGLEPDTEYEFVVVAKNSMGFGPESFEVKAKKSGIGPKVDDSKKLWLLIAIATGSTVFVLAVVVIAIVAVTKKRKYRKRANTFEATELFSNNGLSQYVDPSNYEDPMEAVKTFAAEIDRCQVKLDCAVGGGEFAEVFKGLYDGSTVAVKILKQGSTIKNTEDFMSEASIMGQFRHPNVILLVGVVTISQPMMIVTEFMEGGSLDQFLKEHKGKLTPLQLVGMIRGVASGMVYLSAINFIHRDLAARNVLVGENMICKVSDFGLSRELEDDPDSEYQTQGGKIPIRWTAPEAIRYRKFSSASDVWSFGILMWETMAFGERPYWDWSNFEVIDRVEAGYRLPAPMKCPKIVHGVMMDCWSQDRTQRPRFKEILRRLEDLIRTPEMLNDDLVCYTSAVSADFTKLNTISEWLGSIHMGQYISNFKTAGYSDLTQVTRIKDNDLKDIGVMLIGHRNKIYKSIKSMRRHFDNMPEAV